jgi:hypothetical protein
MLRPAETKWVWIFAAGLRRSWSVSERIVPEDRPSASRSGTRRMFEGEAALQKLVVVVVGEEEESVWTFH